MKDFFNLYEKRITKKVKGTHRLDDTKFREIIETIDDALNEVRRTSEAPNMSAPEILPNLSQNAIYVRGDYRASNKAKTVTFTNVGRLVDGSKIKKNGTLYLQTFKPPKETPAAVSHPDLFEVLKDYIIDG